MAGSGAVGERRSRVANRSECGARALLSLNSREVWLFLRLCGCTTAWSSRDRSPLVFYTEHRREKEMVPIRDTTRAIRSFSRRHYVRSG